MATTIRSKIDNELTSRVGKWFTVRQIQNKLRINPSTLKPLIMKYAREHVLLRRKVKGTRRSVEFSPAARNAGAFKQVLSKNMPYRNLGHSSSRRSPSQTSSSRRTTSRRTTSRRTTSRSRR